MVSLCFSLMRLLLMTILLCLDLKVALKDHWFYVKLKHLLKSVLQGLKMCFGTMTCALEPYCNKKA